LSINLRQAGDFSGIPASRQVSVVIHHYANTPVKIKVNNKAIKLVANQQQLTDHTFAAWYDSNTKQLQIKADWNETVNIAIN